MKLVSIFLIDAVILSFNFVIRQTHCVQAATKSESQP